MASLWSGGSRAAEARTMTDGSCDARYRGTVSLATIATRYKLVQKVTLGSDAPRSTAFDGMSKYGSAFVTSRLRERMWRLAASRTYSVLLLYGQHHNQTPRRRRRSPLKLKIFASYILSFKTLYLAIFILYLAKIAVHSSVACIKNHSNLRYM